MLPATLTRRPVVLLHGLGRTPASMWPMAWRLGPVTHRIGYASTEQNVAASVAEVRTALAPLGPVDLVGHSLGGLIAATILRDPQGLSIGRVVQLGTPNLGSRMADHVVGLWPMRQLCGPALEDLTRHRDIPPRHPQIGAIAGTLGTKAAGVAWPNDGTVSVRSAWAGAGHRTAVPVSHSFLPWSGPATRLTAAFLRDGRFPPRRTNA